MKINNTVHYTRSPEAGQKKLERNTKGFLKRNPPILPKDKNGLQILPDVIETDYTFQLQFGWLPPGPPSRGPSKYITVLGDELSKKLR